jgi:hypothetical protein
VAKSVTAVGASGGMFSPLDISDLELWYDATDGDSVLNAVSPDTPATNGQTVRRWNDLSGNANHVNQTTGIEQPIYNTSEINSKPCVVFDGTNDQLEGGSITPGNATYFVVARRSSSATREDISDIRLPAQTQQVIFLPDASSFDMFAGTVLASSTVILDANFIGTAQFNGVLSLSRVNGVQVATGDVGSRPENGNFFLGSSNSKWLDGPIGEYLRYSRVLSTSEIAQVETYLSAKWGISIP